MKGLGEGLPGVRETLVDQPWAVSIRGRRSFGPRVRDLKEETTPPPRRGSGVAVIRTSCSHSIPEIRNQSDF